MKDTEALSLPIATGDILGGKYCVERLLGRGGMGLVVAARHTVLGHVVAIKLLLPQIASRPGVVQRFLREARASVQLKGDHATRVIDVGTADTTGLPFMVMEYLEGANLATYLRTTRLPVGYAVALVWQACEAIEEAHNLGIVHRDIKPDNLFITKKADGTPFVKVLDFGISQLPQSHPDSARLTGTAEVMGTPLYMSPEQLHSARSADRRSDVWALGVTLFEVLTGQVPFPGRNITEICSRVLTAEPLRPRALRPAIPERLELILSRCLEKRPERRFQRVSELQAALAAFVYQPAQDDAATGPLTRAPTTRSALANASTELDRGAAAAAVLPETLPAEKATSPLKQLIERVAFATPGRTHQVSGRIPFDGPSSRIILAIAILSFFFALLLPSWLGDLVDSSLTDDHVALPGIAILCVAAVLTYLFWALYRGAAQAAVLPGSLPARKPIPLLMYFAGTAAFAILGFFVVYVVQMLVRSLP